MNKLSLIQCKCKGHSHRMRDIYMLDSTLGLTVEYQTPPELDTFDTDIHLTRPTNYSPATDHCIQCGVCVEMCAFNISFCFYIFKLH